MSLRRRTSKQGTPESLVNMFLFLYSCGLFSVLALGLPYWLLRMAASGKYREGLGQRLGLVPKHLIASDGRRAIWIHAVSVGEVLAAGRLVKELARRAPAFRVVLSTTTRTGQGLAREQVGMDNTFYFPLDFAWIVRRYLRRLRPALLVLVETEFWPNVLAECRKADIPVAVVNGRVSDRSFPRYLRLRGLWKHVLSSIVFILAQSEEDVKRLKAIGAPRERVRFGGNLKFDVRAVETAGVTAALRARLPQGTRVLVCGSTLEHEEGILLTAFRELEAVFSAVGDDFGSASPGALQSCGQSAADPRPAKRAPLAMDAETGPNQARDGGAARLHR